MSWNVNVIGLSDAVAVKTAAAFDQFSSASGGLQGNESVILNLAQVLIARTLALQPAGSAVSVNACGIQDSGAGQTLSISIQPVTGFAG